MSYKNGYVSRHINNFQSWGHSQRASLIKYGVIGWEHDYHEKSRHSVRAKSPKMWIQSWRYSEWEEGNLKGESVIAALLPWHMKVSYCTSGFFRSCPPSHFVKSELTFPCGLKSLKHIGYCTVTIMCADHDEWWAQIQTWYNNSPPRV